MNNVISKIVSAFLIFISINAYGQNASLSDQVISDMKYMLEEEKVARDVYVFMDTTWNLRVFNNIKKSEQRHMDMMENLLNTNKIAYKLSNDNGVFYNQDLQKMYDDLIKKGSQSKQDALEVGKLIEVTDISDLEEAIKNTEDEYIKQVYTNLLEASKNHLQAFNRQLSKY
ncbi:DUF2202 domain-containing protein [Olleya sp. R77988]|uniref:DUF2202 domain-containing protein n=1 Tax=Olleya sp. R77988 TaxID=3093875 RepID=UPI0037C7D2FA